MARTSLKEITTIAAANLKSAWTMSEHSWCPLSLTQKQQLFLDLPHMEALYGGAAGGGKTIALAAGALQYVDRPEFHALLLRRTFADLSKPGSLMDVLHDWLSGSGARWNDQRKQWRFPSGAKIQFGYIEVEQDKHRYRSDSYQYIAFDEVTAFEQGPYVYLISRLRRPANSTIPLRVRSGTNPGDIGTIWVMDRFIPEGFSVDDARENLYVEKFGIDGAGNQIKRAFVPALLSDNPGIDQAAYITSLNQLDSVTRAQLLQGDWQIKVRGDVYPEWDERYHVIRWSDFYRLVGSSRIPESWLLGVGMDWGGTESHPYHVTFCARAPEKSILAGKVFVYASLTGYAEPPRLVAEKIYDILKKDNAFDRVHVWLMSHEAKSVRDTMVMDHGLPFGGWKPDRTGGIAQVRDFLQVRGDKPDHFHPDLKGSPSLYLIVADDEYAFAKTDAGLARLRLEFPLYHYDSQGLPERKINDAMDSLRGLAGAFFPPTAPLTQEDKLRDKINSFTLDTPTGPVDEYHKAIHDMSRQYYIEQIIAEEKAKGGMSHPLDFMKEGWLK